ncbi:transcriptional adapter 2-alpha-like isoform X1 [Branchiostoma lanceolatum]|uniref:transcriptional adapter 2-alpha-like isoform X1 n=2 Tax=Branchiostoma lanceolatum TaxID=7740 RepID=UPI003456FDFB
MQIDAAPLDRPPCPGCSTYLMEPFIKCAQCKPPVLLCLQCFARGFEKSGHESDHRYEIVTNEFPVFDLDWTAVEELKLLEALGDCGIGNWQEISNNVGTKSATECESHYLLYYVSRARPPLPVFEEPKNIEQLCPVTAKLSEDPPRPAADSVRAVEMAGYMPARGDFTEEFNNFAEWDIKDIYFLDDDDDLLRALKLAAVDIYQSQLKERCRRKKITRDCGLINLKKHQMYDKRYIRAIRDMKDGLRPFLEFFPPEQFEKVMEGLILEQDIRKEVRRLQELRQAGISTFRAGQLFEKLRLRREEELGRRHMLTDVLSNMQDEFACQQWLHRQAHMDGNPSNNIPLLPLSSTARRSAPPLDLTQFGGYDKLTETEKEVCANVRFLPEAFFEYKDILQREAERQGGLRLAQARQLLKIDVNKTRKLYDFLMQEGVISKPD